jgi:DNA modification methylase
MDRGGLDFFQAVVWDKGGLGMGWKYRRNYEFVMVAHRKGGKLKWENETAGMETANVVRIPKIIPRATDHPTPKPEELIAHFLRLHGKPGDTVLDPFCGSGPVLAVARRMGMKAIGIEIEKQWADMAVERLRVSQEALAL